MNLSLSVVVPHSNHARYVRRRSPASAPSNGRTWKIIVVVDGSIDDTGRVLEELAGRTCA